MVFPNSFVPISKKNFKQSGKKNSTSDQHTKKKSEADKTFVPKAKNPGENNNNKKTIYNIFFF